MSELILSDNLELTNIAKMTTNRVKNLKVSELHFSWVNVPDGYQKAIVRLIRDLAEEKLTPEKRKEKHESLGQMWEQVIWISEQKKVTETLNNVPESLKVEE